MNPQKILVIDDDPSVTRLLKAKLEALGVVAETTNDAAAAAGLASRFKPDLIVCDIDMGEACGGDVAHDIRGNERTSAIPIVFLSSMVTPEDMSSRQAGHLLISKQISMAGILERIMGELPRKK